MTPTPPLGNFPHFTALDLIASLSEARKMVEVEEAEIVENVEAGLRQVWGQFEEKLLVKLYIF